MIKQEFKKITDFENTHLDTSKSLFTVKMRFSQLPYWSI